MFDKNTKTTEIDLADAKLAKEFGMGCLRIKGAHFWPLSHFVWGSSAKSVSGSFVCLDLEHWSKISLLRIEVIRLPRASDLLSDRIEWYSSKRKQRRIKMADGELFDASMLDLKAFDEDWQRDAWPCSKGEVIRTYQAKKFAVIFRFLAQQGTLLDHPVFKRVVKNISIDASAWEKSVPEVLVKPSKRSRIKELPLTEKQTSEMWQIVGAAMKRLKLSKVKDPTQRVKKIEQEIVVARKQSSLTKAEWGDLAIELGTLVGQCFCWHLDWEWCRLKGPSGKQEFCVCSPDRSLSIAPVEWVQALIADQKRAMNCVLTYNMVAAGRLPPARPDSYTRIG